MSRRGLTAATWPLKPPVRLPVPVSAKPSLPKGVCKADAAVGDVQDHVGQSERLVGRRRKELADLAPDHLALLDPALQADASRDDAIDAHAARERPAHLDERVAGDQVGILRIADNQIAHDLRAKAHAVELIGRADAALLELPLQHFRRDGPASDPHGHDEDQEEGQDARRTIAAPRRHRSRRRTITVPSELPLSSLCRAAIGVYQTLPIQGRSVGGMNAPLQQGMLVA